MKLSTMSRALLVAVALMAAAGAALALWQTSNKSERAYRELTVRRGDIDVTVTATGVIQPSNRLEIKPPIAGRVEEVLVREGEQVRRGQVLAWMSSSERAALIDAARAKGPEELKRWEELYRTTPIIAPISGTVILRNAEPGQTFQNQDAVLVMSDRLIVRAQVDETDIALVRLRQPARITLDAYSNKPVAGVVYHIAFEAKTVNNVITYDVDVLPENVPDFMRAGMTANVSFTVESRRGVPLVPTEAVQTRDGRVHVLLPGLRADDAPVEQPVELGLSDGRRSEVLAGVADGDTVLVPQVLMPAGRGSGTNPLLPGRRR